MANERHRQNRPPGDEDLSGGRDREEDINLTSGGVGPSGTGFNSTGRLGGLGNTSDGMHSRRDGDPSVEGDHSMQGGMSIIDTNLTDSGINPYDSGGVNDEDARDGE